MVTEDRVYCSSSFLQYRSIIDKTKCFSLKYPSHFYSLPAERTPITDSLKLEEVLKEKVEYTLKHSKAALALSGGIDSPVLAKFMPKGSTAYTFQCIVPGVEVTNEVPISAKYAEECGLEHKVVEIFWEDFERFTPLLMQAHGMPVHSIEVQIYKAALQAKKDGFDTLIFGQAADALYGGLDKLLSVDWTLETFLNRYSFVMPDRVLKRFVIIDEPIKEHVEKKGFVDVHSFINNYFLFPSCDSYYNAMKCAGVNISMPYTHTYLNCPLDIERIRRGRSKYFVREIFERQYPTFEVPYKTPMPRPMNEWFENWQGPVREEFLPNCVEGMTGDQKWYMYCLEKFLDIIDGRVNEQ